jgi:uncharacterized protein with ATP-grasp and redox domains
MKAYLDCVICQQSHALRILRLATNDHHLHENVLRQVMDHLSKSKWDTDPMTLSKGTYEIITQATGNSDPYKDLKYQSNQEVLQLYPQLQEYIQKSEDPLMTACKLAVAGNIMDFGAKDHFNIQETIQHVLETDFAINHYDSFKTSLHNASSLLLFADNAGEIVFDKLLLETILQHYPLRKLTIVVKKLPIINDATMEDVRQIGLIELPNIDFRLVNTNGNERSAWISPEVKNWIQNHDIVIAKGQANYEVLSDVHGVYFLLIAKCVIVANDTGTSKGALIFKHTSSLPEKIVSTVKDAI